jgi:hypothetical protein
MSKYSLEMVQKPFKQGLKTPKIELQCEITPKTNYITGFKIVIKGKKEERKIISVSKGKLLKAWKEVKTLVEDRGRKILKKD